MFTLNDHIKASATHLQVMRHPNGAYYIAVNNSSGDVYQTVTKFNTDQTVRYLRLIYVLDKVGMLHHFDKQDLASEAAASDKQFPALVRSILRRAKGLEPYIRRRLYIPPTVF
jgi:uncharacterized protein (UPF0128 family)